MLARTANATDGLESAPLLLEEPPITTRVWSRRIGIGATLFLLGAVGLLGHNSQHLRLRRGALQGLQVKYESQCGLVEEDTDYEIAEPWGYGMDHIPTAEMCCALCQGDARCKAFVWVANAGLRGCPSQCWIKGGVPYKKKSAPGVMAGIPPTRKSMPPAIDAPSGQVVKAETGAKAGRSLYCVSLIMPTGYEKGLVAWQHAQQLSIFGCDEYAVYSNTSFEVAPGVTTGVIDSNMHCKFGGDSYTALNSWIFIAFWKQVLSDGRFKFHDWTVKVDADSVFFPHRLVHVLKDHQDAAYINNCRFGLHGPIEVLSQKALVALQEDYSASWDKKAPKECVKKQHFGLYGEDMFIDVCLGKILNQSPRPLEPRIMCEAHCECPSWYWCQNGTDRVVYHPFKTIDAWQNCYANSMTP